MTLEEVFYILGIIVMSLSLILMITITAAILVIRNKINHIHEALEEKFGFAATVADVVKKVVKR